MVVCKFFQNGTCRNGANCKFEHRIDNNNRNSGNNDSRSFLNGGLFGGTNRPERWNLNEQDIVTDLTSTRPNWILSSYGPGKDPPASLFVDNEFSPEELRFRFYTHREAGPSQADGADQEAIRLWNKATNDMAQAANNVADIQKYMIQKEKEHPNRYDFCKTDGKLPREEVAKNAHMNSAPGASSSNLWGGPSRPTASASPFSKPAFGQSTFQVGTSQPASAFGQGTKTSAFGQPSQPSTFGKPPSFGNPAFGQQGFAAATSNNAFAKPPLSGTGFGQTRFGQSTFGQQAQPSSGFGQASNLGQNSGNPFAKPTAASGFGAAVAGPSGFGQPSFGQSAGPGVANSSTGTSTFGQPDFGKPQNAGPSPFGQTTATPAFGQTGFGQQTQTQSQSKFGSSPFSGSIAQGSSPGFAQPQQQQSNAAQPGFGAGFGQNPFIQQQSSTPSSFGTGFGQNLNSQPTGSAFGVQPSTNPFKSNSVGVAGPSAVSHPIASVQMDDEIPSGHPDQQTHQPLPTGRVEASASKPTQNPIRPLLYTQTLHTGPTTFAARGELTRYRSCAVDYRRVEVPTMEGEMQLKELLPRYQRPDNQGFERIWFPRANDEKGVQSLSRVWSDLQADEKDYTDRIRAQYGVLFETGHFEAGRMPLVPPLQEWVDRDF